MSGAYKRKPGAPMSVIQKGEGFGSGLEVQGLTQAALSLNPKPESLNPKP